VNQDTNRYGTITLIVFPPFPFLMLMPFCPVLFWIPSIR